MEKHFVNKFKSSHYKRAKSFKKLEANGLAVFLKETSQGILYGVCKSITVSISRKGNVVVNKIEGKK